MCRFHHEFNVLVHHVGANNCNDHDDDDDDNTSITTKTLSSTTKQHQQQFNTFSVRIVESLQTNHSSEQDI